MSSKGGAVRQPASDLTAFDVSKRSPDDIARLFARWKEQRKSLQPTRIDVRAAADTQRPRPRLMPVLGRDAAVAEEAVEPPPKTARSVRYSAPFAAVLETGASGALADRLDSLTFTAAQKSRAARLDPSSVGPDGRSASRAKRRSRSRWILAGAASVLAVAAASGAALWRDGATEAPASARTTAPVAAPTHDVATASGIAQPVPRPPIAVRMAARLLPAATRSPTPEESPWQAAIDAGLMHPLPPEEAVHVVRLAPKLKPPVPEVQTASKTPAEQSPEPIAASGMEIKPEAFVPGRPVSRSPSAVSVAIPAALTPQSGAEDENNRGTRPEALYRRGNDKNLIGDRGSHPQHGANDSRPSPGAASGGQGDNSGSSAGGGSSSGSSGTGGDPSSGTGGSTGAGGSSAGGGTTGSGASGSTGSGSGGAGGTGDAGSGTTGDTGSSADSGSGGSSSASGGGTGGATGGGDTGGSTGGATGGSTGGTTGGGDTGGSTGSDAGGSTSGDAGGSTSGDTGGATDSGSGDGGSSDSGSSDSGSGDSGSSDSGGLSGHADVDVGGGGISGSVGGSVGGIGGSIGGSIGGGGGKIGGGLKL